MDRSCTGQLYLAHIGQNSVFVFRYVIIILLNVLIKTLSVWTFFS